LRLPLLTLQVAVRKRPLFQAEAEHGSTDVINIVDKKVRCPDLARAGSRTTEPAAFSLSLCLSRLLKLQMVVVMDQGWDPDDFLRQGRSREMRYAFDYAFNEDTRQEQVYASTTKTILSGVLAGFNACAFAYGATGSGA
jgi:hypothetical protein